MGMKQEALLRNWRVEPIGNGLILVGEVYGHPRFPNNKRIHTSRVLRIDFDKLVAETLNTYYKLEGATNESSKT